MKNEKNEGESSWDEFQKESTVKGEHYCLDQDELMHIKQNHEKLSYSRREFFEFLNKCPEIDRKTDKQPSPKEDFGDSPLMLRITPGLPTWFSVMLFYNLDASVTPPSGYMAVTGQDVLNMMDLGVDPSNPLIQDFIYDYWNTLSHGNLRFSVDIVRNADNTPYIPVINPPGGNPQAVEDIARLVVQSNPQGVWEAAGSIVRDGRRFIPSVVLVHRYSNHPSARINWNFDFSNGGNNYRVAEYHHLDYSNTLHDFGGGCRSRNFWSTLCHEYAHNFTDAYDLYGPGGCTGYWDILGCHLEPKKMSELSAIYKAAIGWLTFKEIISSNMVPNRTLELRPYTSSGDAYKIMPDPDNNPHEYFILEYRKSIGTDAYVPDGGLPYEGLLITHINQRMGFGPVSWMLREAPFFDPEYADFSEFGEALWQGIGHLEYQNPLYPQTANNAFTPTSNPNSNFYGQRPSGLSITNIRLEEGLCRCELSISGGSRVGWQVSNSDRGLAGRFSNNDPSTLGQEIFMRNDNNVALLVHKKGEVFVRSHQFDWIDSWNLGTDNRELVGDFDGDGLDEIYLRSPEWAGLLKYRSNRFACESIQYDWIDSWNLGSDNWEIVADIDGDGRDEIIVRSPTWMGVLKYNRGRFNLIFIKDNDLETRTLSAIDKLYKGNFSRRTKEEILLFNGNSLALFSWENSTERFILNAVHENVLDGWTFQLEDQLYIADLDGDGFSEIYIRNTTKVGVLKWDTNRFVLLWSSVNTIPHINNVMERQINLSAADLSYSGRFFTNKDGIVHRNNNQMALLIWENNRMNVRLYMATWYTSPWQLAPNDKFILGDFHRVGMEGYAQNPGSRTVVPFDFITNNLTDIFIHNTWGTAMSCLNYVPANTGNPDWLGVEWACTWIAQEKILFES